MKVWVLWDRLSEVVLGVFSTMDLADEAAHCKYPDEHQRQWIEIWDFVIDAPVED